MSDLLDKINTVINEAIEEAGGDDKVTELIFSEKSLNIGRITNEIKTAIEKCPNVDFLGFSQCKLTSLENFPKLAKLVTVDLKDNQIDDQEIKHLSDLKDLKDLYLEGNNIERIETLEELAQTLSSLSKLEVVDNPVTELYGFADKIWKAFPTLEVLNFHDKNGNKVQDNQADVEEDELESEDQYEGREESEDSPYSEGDYSEENEKPKKKRKTK